MTDNPILSQDTEACKHLILVTFVFGSVHVISEQFV